MLCCGLLLLAILASSRSQLVDRDIVLTPRQGLQVNGRSIYYNPAEERNSVNSTYEDEVPWEQALKYVTFLTLSGNMWSNADWRSHHNYSLFKDSKYMRNDHDVAKFGDIITLASGRLEKTVNKQLAFIEGLCGDECAANRTLAFWQVQKIRHRDAQRSFRYELKFNVNPLLAERSDNGKRAASGLVMRSFLMKDDDYPGSFLTSAERRFDLNSNEVAPLRRLGGMPDLNIGEYVREPPSNRRYFPTTFRPNYHLSFFDLNPRSPKSPQPVVKSVTHHMHHHFYNTPAPISNQIPVPPPHIVKYGASIEHVTSPLDRPVIYMHVPPVYLYSSYNNNADLDQQTDHPQHDEQARKPFVESEKDEIPDEERFSEPDPLYAIDLPDSTSPRYEENVEIESPSVHGDSESEESLPDSINAQLPPPDEGQDVRIPYVDTSVVTATSVEALASHQTTAEVPTTPEPTHTTSTATQKPRAHFQRSTSERPVLKWKPKRKLKIVPSSTTSTTTTTPAPAAFSTRQSVSKSVSFKVGNQIRELLREVDMQPAELVQVQTNSSDIRLFKAGRGANATSDELSIIEKTILEHASKVR